MLKLILLCINLLNKLRLYYVFLCSVQIKIKHFNLVANILSFILIIIVFIYFIGYIQCNLSDQNTGSLNHFL